MERETVGKISSDLLLKEPLTRDPIELEREMHKEYEKNIIECAERGSKIYRGDFYVVVLTKKERLMQNVIRHYYFHRSSCPTPDYDQAVYKANQTTSEIEFIWVIPSRDTCFHFKQNRLSIDPSEQGLLDFVLKFDDGTLRKLAKKLNKEKEDSPLLETCDN